MLRNLIYLAAFASEIMVFGIIRIIVIESVLVLAKLRKHIAGSKYKHKDQC